jgi:hypothetical protein
MIEKVQADGADVVDVREGDHFDPGNKVYEKDNLDRVWLVGELDSQLQDQGTLVSLLEKEDQIVLQRVERYDPDEPGLESSPGSNCCRNQQMIVLDCSLLSIQKLCSVIA